MSGNERPVPPITLYDHGDLDVFADVALACLDLEIYDAAEDGRQAFDSRGTPLRIVTRGYDVVDIVVAENALPVPQDLETWLRNYIRSTDPDSVGLPNFESASLDTLLISVLRDQAGVPYEGPVAKVLRILRGRKRASP
ncbi:hypothetical protein [Aeromicrobium sp. CF3.5]|uniref:hypothetical protein n=1 Tax=Aeromicrobium sp. CF3.5 TaxID=3373078 RepID=UPI003EE4BF0C